MHYDVALTAYRNVVVLPIISEKRSNRVSVMFMVIVTGHIVMQCLNLNLIL